MKREGRQHGTVRISRSKVLKTAAAADAEAAAPEPLEVAFALTAATEKAAGKPTNASRSTGKCRRPRCAGCHAHPVTKARDKAKGAHKLRACDVALNHRLVSWRVVDQGSGGSGVPEYRGKSASSLLAYLAGGNSWYEEDDDAAAGEGGGFGAPDNGLSDLYDLFVGRRADSDADAEDGGEEADPDLVEARDTDLDDVGAEIQAIGEQGLLLDAKDENGDEEEEEEEDDMGFCMVGVTIAVEFSDGEEDWIVVEEI